MSGEVDRAPADETAVAPRTTGAMRRSGRHATPGVRLPRGHVIAGRYRIEELLGEGGMGTVFRAAHLSLRKDVAVKVMRPELAADVTMGARFEREAYAASRIQHPHVVVVHDFGRDGDLLYLVMEMLEGESLAARIDRSGAFGVPEALRTTSHILRALATAHALKIVHRDLKPDNVHVDHAGTHKVLDFGIARIVDSAEPQESAGKVTMAGMIVGTPLYMSPEMAARQPVGPPADIYAVGVMLYEMITGVPPFLDEQPIVVMSRHLTEEPAPMSQVAPGVSVPARVDALVRRLLSKDPAQRGTAGETLAEVEAIRAAIASGDISTALPMPIHSVSSDMIPGSAAAVTDPALPARRRSVALIVGIATLAVLLVGGAVTWAVTSTSSPSPAPDRTAAIVPDPPSALAEPDPPSAVEPARVTVRFMVTPATARIVSDDGELVDGALVLPRDGERHPVRIEAAGYQSRTYDVVADLDREFVVELRRAPAPSVAASSMEADRPRDRQTARELRRARMEAMAAMADMDDRPSMRDTGLRTRF